MKTHKTIFNYGEEELTIEKSRFIGYAIPVGSESDAIEFIEKIKKKHWDATHNVPVYIVGDGMEIQRYSDDGEPSGTAGVPVLEMLKKEGITNICVVMTRYFGGVKLGTGGLVRAYTQTAKCALDAAIIVTKKVFNELFCEVDYHYHGKIQNYLSGTDQVIVHETIYSDRVKMVLYVDPEYQNRVEKDLVDLTSGQVDLKKGEMVFLTVRNGGIYHGNGSND